MIALHVEVTSGHYGYPGVTQNLGLKYSAPVPHPSTIQGFLESLMGMKWQTLKGRFAYGVKQAPVGRAEVLRTVHTLMSIAATQPRGKEHRNEGTRVSKVEKWFWPQYTIVYEGPLESTLRASLKGEVERFGTVYLGESDDLVDVVAETDDLTARWVVPGTSTLLTVKTKHGFSDLKPEYKAFDLGEPGPLAASAWLTC